MYKEGAAFGFMGLDNQKIEDAKTIILPVPYEGTVSYTSGTRYGPEMIIKASIQCETFDTELKKDYSLDAGIYTASPMQPNLNSPEAMSDDVLDAVKGFLEMGKFVVMLGGEHSITLGAVKAFKERYQNLTVLQIDAHADLRDEYEGTGFSHACVMRRIRELGVNVVQVGIRNHSLAEQDYIAKNRLRNIFYAPFAERQIKDIVKACTDDVYLTIDVDGFDPSIVPATGTPVPGGMLWYESLALFRELFRKKTVIGMDVVELSRCGSGTMSEDLVATLIYRLIGYRLAKS
jgi:agmatinase